MLVDTSGLLCFLHRDEPEHPRAVQILTNTKPRWLIHNYILAELVALALIRRLRRDTVISYVLELLANDYVEIVWVDEKLHRQAIDLLLARPDKTYSLCDAVSFILMRQKGIREALTTDKHFEQEEFIRLL
jgi:predicted nucleic acid-binding protein